jgi:hypothetical protein
MVSAQAAKIGGRDPYDARDLTAARPLRGT